MTKRTRWNLTRYIIGYASLVGLIALFTGHPDVSLACLALIGTTGGIYKASETYRKSETK